MKSGEKFNEKYPVGTPTRADIENTINNDYIRWEMRDCSHEIWWRSINSDITTPARDKLQSMGIHI